MEQMQVKVTAALEELRSIPQWVCWRYVQRTEGGKPTKPPVNPHTGGPCSINNPTNWASYDVAERWAERNPDRVAGTGFVLTATTGFVGIDLDHVRDPLTGAIEPWVREIIDFRETYAEVSPSGTGIRMIARGSISKAITNHEAQVEIYGFGRYLTITGWHIHGAAETIGEATKTIEALAARVASMKPMPAEPIEAQSLAPIPSGPREPSGSGTPYFRNVNDAALANLGAWVTSLFPRAEHQAGTGAYRVKSKVLGRRLEEDLSIHPQGITDWGVADMGDPRAGKRTPLDLVLATGEASNIVDAARWMCDRLGRAPEDLGWNDGEPPTTKLDLILPSRFTQLETGEIVDDETGEISTEHDLPPLPVFADPFPEHLTYNTGFLGKLTDWIHATAPAPRRAFSLMSAVAMIGTMAGRYWAGPTSSGTHLYIVLLAPSGSGKDHYIRLPMKIFSDLQCHDMIGEDNFMSQGAINNLVAEKPLTLCCMDEFSDTLAKMSNSRASTHESAMGQTIKGLWGVNYMFFKTPGYAGSRGKIINAPALSIFAATTHEKFWKSLDKTAKADGFLNRFMLFPFHDDAEEREPEIRIAETDLPDWMIDGFTAIHFRGAGLKEKKTALSRQEAEQRKPVHVPWENEDMVKVFRDYAKDCRKRYTPDDDRKEFLARTAENAIRLATIRALGTNAINPVVTLEDFRWGVEIAEWACRQMMIGAGEYMSETEFQSNAQAVIRIIKKAGGTCSHSVITKKMNNKLKSKDLRDLLETMIESSTLVVLPSVKPTRGQTGKWYRLGSDMD